MKVFVVLREDFEYNNTNNPKTMIQAICKNEHVAVHMTQLYNQSIARKNEKLPENERIGINYYWQSHELLE